MTTPYDYEQPQPFDDDEYWINQREADDYRHELDDYDDYDDGEDDDDAQDH
jgi:hypothetical protein